MTYQNFTVSVEDSVARVTLNRPQAYNAIDLQSARELCDIANRLTGDPRVRAILITGSGDKAFCAGGDVGSFARDPESVGLLLRELTGYYHLAISRLAWGGAPVLAAVNGVAAGAGLSLVAACDLVIAADTATFTSAYTRIGLTPDGSSTYFLPRIIGVRRATELYLSSRVLGAAEALDWGLVNRVVPAAELAGAAADWARELAAGPTRAFAGVKRLVAVATTETLESQMERETREIVDAAQTADGREGVRSFVEKRKPRFTGQ